MEIRDLCKTRGLQVPFICCATAYSEASFKRNAIEAGMNDFISKPIQNETIKKLLRDALGFD